MADLFGTTKQNISKHLNHIFDEGELSENSVVNEKLTTATDNKSYLVKFYNLDAIISVGYRVNSNKATQFRIWATRILKEYLVKGFAMDDDRLKQGEALFGKDYFDELLERIRDIRASERRFYQKVTDIYIQCSYDYDVNAETTKQFFAHAQNKLEYAVVHMTAAEIIKKRADHKLPNMGLTSWKNQKRDGKVLKSDTTVAKNYLSEKEISELNRLVNMFLDHAENLAAKGKRMSMEDWQERLDVFLRFNEYEVLANYGKIKKKIADSHADIEYEKFKPIQDAEYRSDFDNAVAEIKSKGVLPKSKK
ncbi:MAG: virulence RhuM family protein [Pyrinomonadaceae bacterium]